jgi:lysophospholipid acyltransferase (LPLAT)-like uncharacterized protein
MQPNDFKQKMALSLAPPLAVAILRALAATWRIKETGQRSLSPLAGSKQTCIYTVWHESVLAAGFYRDEAIHALASQSFDGELISRTLMGLGWPIPARGSSSRGGSAALAEMQGFLGQGDHVLLTVDGPRGPRRLAKDGAIKLSRLSGHPVVPVAFACRPQPRLKTWDRMVIPRPSRAASSASAGSCASPDTGKTPRKTCCACRLGWIRPSMRRKNSWKNAGADGSA